MILVTWNNNETEVETTTEKQNEENNEVATWKVKIEEDRKERKTRGGGT